MLGSLFICIGKSLNSFQQAGKKTDPVYDKLVSVDLG